MLSFNKPYLTGKPSFFEKFGTLKNQYKFLLLLVFNILFFTVFANILPFRFEENDDVMMCLIASGAYSGIPDAHLVFINYIYGCVLTFFYNTFSGVEWYTIFFCIIHIAALSVIIFSILKTKKSFWIKCLFALLVYAVEIRIILLFQFTTTAAICGFAGCLLLFWEKRICQIFGVCLFLLGALIRFEATMLVLLLMLPIFGYEIIRTKNIIKMLVPVACCLIFSFISQLADNQAYRGGGKWAHYKTYNKLRGKINDNPNWRRINDKLPEGISGNDYAMLMSFFPDGNVIDLVKIKEINSLIQDVPLLKKLKNIYPSLRKYAVPVCLISLLFVCLLLSENQRKKRVYLLSYLLFYIGILSLIATDGSLKERVFISTLFPVFFFVFINLETFLWKKIMSYGIIGFTMLFLLDFSRKTNKRRTVRNDANITFVEQKSLLEKIYRDDVVLVPVAGSLGVELWNPFYINEYFSKFDFKCFGWLTNFPLNKGSNSHLSLVDEKVYMFMELENKENFVPRLQSLLIEHYNCPTETVIKAESENYSIIQLKPR